MAKFIGVHRMPGSTEEQMQNGWERYKTEAIKLGLKPIRVHISPSTGMGFCLTEAPSKEQVVKAHEQASAPAPEEIVEVKILE